MCTQSGMFFFFFFFKEVQGDLFRRNFILSTTFSQLPVRYKPINIPLVVCNLLSENEILGQVFNLLFQIYLKHDIKWN